jgi:hypothetical protein
MTDRWRAPGGWTVEVVQLTSTPDRHDGQWLRVKQYGIWTADVRTVGELAHFVDLAELEPELGQLMMCGVRLPDWFCCGRAVRTALPAAAAP